MHKFDLTIDVTEAAGLGEPAAIAMTVQLPDPARLGTPAIVCFAKPGGGYSKGYYTVDLPGPAAGAQSDWHVARGWIFVSVDHLGVGDSTLHAPEVLTYNVLAGAAQAAEAEVLVRLAAGTLIDGYPAILDPVTIGIGQSMGGLMTIIQQGRFHGYDGIASLGYSAIHNSAPAAPGAPPIVHGWSPRDTLITEPRIYLNAPRIARTGGGSIKGGGRAMGWGFHWDDIDPALIDEDLARFENTHTPQGHGVTACPPWGSLTFPGAVARTSNTPGICASEAAAIECPVLSAMGEKDTVVDPKREPMAFWSARSVDLFQCPRMGHMHNFAGTRELFWRRIELWSAWVIEAKGKLF
jgi:hypothetical protein